NDRLAQVHEALSDFAAALEASPELRSVLRNPQLEPAAKAGILAEIVGEEERLSVELTTARELTDAEAKAIVKQIEQAAGRTVEATRSVDPDLVGGIVLQAGSYRVDASVRGRLERLRQTLVRS